MAGRGNDQPDPFALGCAAFAVGLAIGTIACILWVVL